MRALPQTLPANAALLATGVTSAGAACSLGGCCRLTRGVIVGDALALRVCLCVPTFRFRETEEAFMNATSTTRKPRTMCGMASTICAMLLVFSLDAANSWADIPYVSHDWHYSASVLILALAVALACLSVCAGACAHPLGSARFETVDRAAGMRRAMKRAADGETVARDVFRREWAPKSSDPQPVVEGSESATPDGALAEAAAKRRANRAPALPSWGRSASVLRGWVTHGRAGIFLWVLMAVAIYAWRNAALADGSTGWLGARDAGIAAMTTKLFALVVVPLDSASYLRFLILDLPIKLIAGFTLHGLDDPGGYHSLAGAVTWETMLSIAFGFLVRSTELQSREHFAAGCNAARQRRQLQSLQLQLVETDRESREAVLVLDPVTARVVSASPSCTRLLGWLPSEFMASQNIYELLVDLDMLPLALDMAVADRLHWLRMFPGKPFG
ncbi:hypothetical protein FNF31_03453 [Cafeteria roenbergensis]|uniref:PAS domain-containing protein n=1 Tax=Cafeteria roenbergensis TaxID=33653 RepID=A0A5A8D901_CAFRO|nr:hypothetical protein FNF31_03453 [Cafeteria roenbergensis]